MENVKSRNQSLYDYFECLQMEYIVCELRRKIYSRRKDKQYYQRTMDRKREKIEDIAERNLLPTIFTDTKAKEALYSKIYPTHGYPNFIYNENDREELEEKDFLNYYGEGSEVRVLMEDESVEVGTITGFFPEKKLVQVKLRGTEESAPFLINRVTRIL